MTRTMDLEDLVNSKLGANSPNIKTFVHCTSDHSHAFGLQFCRFFDPFTYNSPALNYTLPEDFD